METRNSQIDRNFASLLILAGGKSMRFGEDKSLNLKIGEKPLLQVLAERFGDLFAETVIISDRPGKFNVPGTVEAVDGYPMRGPLGGIHAGLRATHTPWVLVMACDMPAVDRNTVKKLLLAASGTDAQAVIPRHELGYEPLCAMYRSDIVGAVEKLLVQNEHRPGLLELLRQLDVLYLKTQNCFFNVNTPQDAACIPFKKANSNVRHKCRYRDFFGT